VVNSTSDYGNKFYFIFVRLFLGQVFEIIYQNQLLRRDKIAKIVMNDRYMLIYSSFFVFIS